MCVVAKCTEAGHGDSNAVMFKHMGSSSRCPPVNQLCVTSGVTLGKLFLLAEPCSPHLQEEDKKCPLPEVTVRMKLLICVKQCLAHVSGCCHHHHHRRHCHFSVSVCQATCKGQEHGTDGTTLFLPQEAYHPVGKPDIHQIME